MLQDVILQMPSARDTHSQGHSPVPRVQKNEAESPTKIYGKQYGPHGSAGSEAGCRRKRCLQVVQQELVLAAQEVKVLKEDPVRALDGCLQPNRLDLET